MLELCATHSTSLRQRLIQKGLKTASEEILALSLIEYNIFRLDTKQFLDTMCSDQCPICFLKTNNWLEQAAAVTKRRMVEQMFIKENMVNAAIAALPPRKDHTNAAEAVRG